MGHKSLFKRAFRSRVKEIKMENETTLQEEVGVKTLEPNMARVVMLNDNYTPMDFVVHILIDIFKKSRQEAEKIMLDVHNTGSGICGLYPYDIAELRVHLATNRSRENHYPLKFDLIYEDHLDGG